MDYQASPPAVSSAAVVAARAAAAAKAVAAARASFSEESLPVFGGSSGSAATPASAPFAPAGRPVPSLLPPMVPTLSEAVRQQPSRPPQVFSMTADDDDSEGVPSPDKHLTPLGLGSAGGESEAVPSGLSLPTDNLSEEEQRQFEEIEEQFRRFKTRQSKTEADVAALLQRLNTHIHIPSSIASSECGDLTSMASSEWDAESFCGTEDGLSVLDSRMGSRAPTPPGGSPAHSPRDLQGQKRPGPLSALGRVSVGGDWRTPQKGVTGGTGRSGGERGDLLEGRGGAASSSTAVGDKELRPRLTPQLLAAQDMPPWTSKPTHASPSCTPPTSDRGGAAEKQAEEPPVPVLTASLLRPLDAARPVPSLGLASPEDEELRRWQGWTVVATAEGRLFFHSETRQISQWTQPPELADILGEWEEITDETATEGQPSTYWRNEVVRMSLWKDPRPTTNIFQAALDGNLFFMQLYAEVEGQIDVIDPRGRSALHYACAGGTTQSVMFLLQRRAEVDRPDDTGATPLIFACRYGYAPVVKVLCDAHADLNAAAAGDSTALHEAAAMGQLDCVHLLLLCGADATKHNSDGQSALDVAMAKRHQTCATLLRGHLHQQKLPPAEGAAPMAPLQAAPDRPNLETLAPQDNSAPAADGIGSRAVAEAVAAAPPLSGNSEPVSPEAPPAELDDAESSLRQRSRGLGPPNPDGSAARELQQPVAEEYNNAGASRANGIAGANNSQAVTADRGTPEPIPGLILRWLDSWRRAIRCPSRADGAQPRRKSSKDGVQSKEHER